ncbi:inositol phosphatase [Reticulibacter mediterranei]|uniref:Inositol phosphatase n=1 Tax=Reticulibacter mediterranei TaxID=2778369 RepID=A0A8J3MXU9_9CHLR|nr:inositol monophosphatase [Reticulibacter mediterranei]GHO90217.1 inositol phosphatase [Reticulibacter mediterranei]
MDTHGIPSDAATTTDANDALLLEKVIDAVHDAGKRLLAIYSPDARPANWNEILEAGRRNEEASLDGLRAALEAARPQAQWVDDDQETVLLPSGEWWAVDAAEGSVNHVHGLSEWCVSATLLRDNTPVLAAVYQPIGDLTYTAIRGGGAYLNGRPLRTSTKSDLAVAIVTTGQAEAGQAETYRRFGDAITVMLGHALLVRATVPSTFPLFLIASGHYDVFWQYEPVLPGIAAGALFITEAGGIVSDIHGHPWRPGSPDFLAASPKLHAAAVEVLSTVV